MADRDASVLPPVSPDHRRIAAAQFERANQVIATGNYDYGIRLLLECLKLDPANLGYRQTLRRTQKRKYNNNQRGSALAWLTTMPTRARIKRARAARDFLRVLELGEQVLGRNPWDVGVQVDMAGAAEVLGLLDLAVWNLGEARQSAPNNIEVNRLLARLYERRGNFQEAMVLWERVRKADPTDTEAMDKAKDLAAHETIARGHYEEAVGTTPSVARVKTGESSQQHAPLNAPEGTAARKPTGTKSSGEIHVNPLLARIEADPTNANGYLQLAGQLRKAGKGDQARDLLQKGLAATGNSFEIQVELLDLEIEPVRKNLQVAEEKLRKGGDEEARKLRGKLAKEVNARELELYRLKSDRYPNDSLARTELGVRLLRAGQVDEAIKELQAARSDPRQQWRCLYWLGHCFKARNNWRLARRNFEEALQLLPSGEDATRKELLFTLAEGCAESGDLQTAVDLAHELANVDFAYKNIGQRLDEWQQRLDQSQPSARRDERRG